MSNKLKKKKIKNKIKKNKKRRTIRRKGENHLNLGQHQQNLPQYTRTVYVNAPSQQSVGPDQGELINQVMHNNNFIKKNNLLLQNDLNNQVQEEKKEHPLDRAKVAFDARGGTVSNNLSNTVFRIPNEKKAKQPKHTVEYLDDDGYDGESDLNKMVQQKKGNDLNAVIERKEDKIQEHNDDRNVEPVVSPDIMEAVKDVKKRFNYVKSAAQILKERNAKDAKEDKEIENELHQQALKVEVNDALKLKGRSSRLKSPSRKGTV